MMPPFLNAAPVADISQPAIIDVLAAFVAINTLMYVCLALAKMLPRLRVPKALRRPYARSETRSIHPTDAP